MVDKAKMEIKHVSKGWGYEKWIVNKPEYCGKLLFFAKGKRCSWHYHLLKDETFFLQSGKIHLFYGFDNDIGLGDSIVLEQGDKFHIERKMRHQMVALEDSELFEFSTQHFDTDSYRIMVGD